MIDIASIVLTVISIVVTSISIVATVKSMRKAKDIHTKSNHSHDQE
ncbi:MAG: hypothetical protein IJO70_00295 [Lachnospiraceae bacterium]|nr:hypothetical protein [Lachnospiraceae bacterium]